MARKDRTGERKPRGAAPRRTPDMGYYIIVTDTNETEKNDMEGLRKSLPEKFQGRIVISVSKAKTSELVEACLEYASTVPQYGIPCIMFDRDRVPNYDKIIRDAGEHGIIAAWSNPCLEIWLDTYFGKMHPYMESVSCCSGFSRTFHEKAGVEYAKSDKNLYELLNRYGDEKGAISISRRRHQQWLRDGAKKPSEMCPCTTVYQLIDEIKNKITEE